MSSVTPPWRATAFATISATAPFPAFILAMMPRYPRVIGRGGVSEPTSDADNSCQHPSRSDHTRMAMDTCLLCKRKQTYHKLLLHFNTHTASRSSYDLHSGFDIIGVEIFHLLLGNLFELCLRDRAGFFLVWLA